MSRKVKVILSVGLVSAVGLSAYSASAYDTSLGHGYQRMTMSKGELCVVPKRLPGVKQDKLSSDEQDLCSVDFYNDPRIAICPKSFSTNPAVEAYQLPDGLVKAQFEARTCLLPETQWPTGDLKVKKLAKFKSSTSCSYTPSILGYAQLSRFFDAGRVPESVVRTMDLATHKKIAEMGKKTPLKSFWATLLNKENNPSRHPELVTKDLKQLYGAFSANPRGEEKYRELFGPKHTYEKGLWAFTQTPIYKSLLNPKPLSQTVARDFAASAQIIQQQKDVSDMILLDHLMNQQDRFGNIHKKGYYQFIEDGKLESKSASKADPVEMKAKGAVLVQEMIMKDNDCGVVKGNLVKNAGILAKLRHLSPRTYRKLLKLDAMMKEAETREYFQDELLFTQADVTSVSRNIADAAKILKANCKAGLLNLDLDTELHLGLKKAKGDLCEPALN